MSSRFIVQTFLAVCNVKDHVLSYWFYFQVVRYHSLVIEAGSLPDDLMSIAWTASPNLLSYHESEPTNVSPFLGSLDNNFMAIPLEHSISCGEQSNISNANASESDGSRVIMAIRHSKRPHYGVQVF
jgi:para-aminobenzoate synthetase